MAASAPLFTSIPGYGLIGLRVGIPFRDSSDLFVDLFNISDKSFRESVGESPVRVGQ